MSSVPNWVKETSPEQAYLAGYDDGIDSLDSELRRLREERDEAQRYIDREGNLALEAEARAEAAARELGDWRKAAVDYQERALVAERKLAMCVEVQEANGKTYWQQTEYERGRAEAAERDRQVQYDAAMAAIEGRARAERALAEVERYFRGEVPPAGFPMGLVRAALSPTSEDSAEYKPWDQEC